MNDKTITSVGQAIKAYKIDTARVLAEAKADARKRGKRWHFVGRGVEIIALDDNGERNDDLGGPDFIAMKDLTVKYLTNEINSYRQYSPSSHGRTLGGIHLAGGFDVHDDFATFMADSRDGCLNYEIWDDWSGQDIPLELFEEPNCFMCPAKAEHRVHGKDVCEVCASEIA